MPHARPATEGVLTVAPRTYIAVDSEAVGWLTVHALNEIAQADIDEGCCPMCCAPCNAVARLLNDGQLDQIVRPVADGYGWWDAANDHVDRDLLQRAWRMTECHP